MSSEEKKPAVDPPTKSSMEILSELFSTFDAEPPVIVKNEVDEESAKKHKKSKKKHKHKDKKHRKKPKKRKHSPSHSSDSSAVDLTDLLIKKEKRSEPVDLNGACLKKKIESIKVEHDVTETNSKNGEGKLEQDDSKKKRIVIKDLKFSSIFDATILAIKEQEKLKESTEDGELSQSDANSGEDRDVEKHRMKKEKHKKKQKHGKHDAEKSRKRKRSNRSPSRKRSRSLSVDSTKSEKFRDKSCVKIDRHHHHKDRHKRRSSDRDSKDESITTDSYSRRNTREKDEFRRHSRECHEHRRSKERGDYDHEDKKHKYNSFYRTDIDKEEKWSVKERYRGRSDRNRERRFRETSEDGATTHIDKKKLLEIARKNAIQMMKSGSLPGALTLGPQAQEKVIAAIKSGGKTVEELTDFCKTLSKKEELGELSSVSEDNMSDSDGEKPFHHPFQIKERPVSITMNIKNSVPLPIKNSQERASELRIQFPVSSGQQHRKTENEWIPVLPKKTEAAAIKPTPATNYVATSLQTELPPQPVISSVPLPSPAPSVIVPAHSVPQVFLPTASTEQNIDIATIVSQRLSAMRKLQENPDDVKALNVMYKAQKEMNSWAESKQQIGQFTGSTGAQILSLAELSSGYQAWARKDQFQTAAPVSGGMGMHLLQKMGWKPGEGLGKEKTGALEPLLLEVKLDKKGIVAKEEQKKKQAKLQKATPKTLQGKHPVSLLGEYASKHKLGAPQYDLCFECGPDHKKNFLFRVILNGVEYKPQVASPNKKEAKANAALICLQQLGILQET